MRLPRHGAAATGLAAPVLACLLAGCGGVDTRRPQSGFVLISEAEEFRLGDQFAADMERQRRDGKVRYAESIGGDYLASLGRRLLAVSARPNVPCRFYLIEDDVVNAFAVPGHVYVYTGLIKLTETESELAAVLGHEIGHVVGRHSAKRVSQVAMAELGERLFLELVVGERAGAQLAAIGTRLALTGAIKKFSRDDERQADLLGVEQCAKAGLDPTGAIRVFRKFEQLQQTKPTALELLFADHPYSGERAENVRRHLETLRVPADVRADSPEFRAWRARVLGR